MRKYISIGLILFLVIIGVSNWNIQQRKELVMLRESVETMNVEKKALEDTEKKLIHENEVLSKKAQTSAESLKEFQQQISNKKAEVDLSSEFINIVTNLFEANLNFTPKDYLNKKKQVSSYLSEELNKEYFGQNRETYQDVNNTISQLESLEVFPKKLHSNNFEGLVIVYHKNKRSGQDWRKAMNIFKVAYNCETKRISVITNLGNGYWER